MGGTIQVTPDRLVDARSQISAVAEDLRTGLESVSADIASLLARGWTGHAAEGFYQAWQQWQTGSAHVLEALDATGALLMAGALEYEAQEDRTRSAFSTAVGA